MTPMNGLSHAHGPNCKANSIWECWQGCRLWRSPFQKHWSRVNVFNTGKPASLFLLSPGAMSFKSKHLAQRPAPSHLASDLCYFLGWPSCLLEPTFASNLFLLGVLAFRFQFKNFVIKTLQINKNITRPNEPDLKSMQLLYFLFYAARTGIGKGSCGVSQYQIYLVLLQGQNECASCPLQ